jgi:Flp pilus assembly protein TadG
MNSRKISRRRGGTAALELAVTLPFVMAAVLGGLDLGRFAYTYIAVTNAARSGAAYASLNPAPVQSGSYNTWITNCYQPAVLDEMRDFNAGSVTIANPVTTIDSSGFQRVRAHVSYPFTTLVNWSMVPNSFNISRDVEMRVIRF